MTTPQGMLELADELRDRETRLNQCLADFNWKPSRSHIESARNAIGKAQAALRQAAAPQGREALIEQWRCAKAAREYFETLDPAKEMLRANVKAVGEEISDAIFALTPAVAPESARAFYGAECPSYPACDGGCGLGCTKEIERRKEGAVAPDGAGEALAEIWRLCDRASYYSKSRLVKEIAGIVETVNRPALAQAQEPGEDQAYTAFIDACENPAPPTQALIDLFREHGTPPPQVDSGREEIARIIEQHCGCDDDGMYVRSLNAADAILALNWVLSRPIQLEFLPSPARYLGPAAARPSGQAGEVSMGEFILDGGEQLDGSSRLLKLNDTPDGTCVTVSIPKVGIVAVLDRSQQRELIAYLAKRLWPLSRHPPSIPDLHGEGSS